MTSSVIYYSTDARKNEIYLLNIAGQNTKFVLLPMKNVGFVRDSLLLKAFIMALEYLLGSSLGGKKFSKNDAFSLLCGITQFQQDN